VLIYDYAKLATGSVTDNPLRTFLTTLGITIGIAAVILLTSIGEGVNQFIIKQFTQFGTTLIQIQPGKTTVMGGSVSAINTTRPLSIDDVTALSRLPYIEASVGFVVGNAEIKANQRQRRTSVYGTSPDFPRAFAFQVAMGSFLPGDNPHTPRATAVIGNTVKNELYGDANPLGEFIRVGGSRYRVIGVMEPKGQMLGFDLDDTVYLPLARAMSLFNSASIMEIDLSYREDIPVETVVENVQQLLTTRHGTDDITITSQEQMMAVLNSILKVLTSAVAGLGTISLVVGGIGILTIMMIAVRERTKEIGLLRALGATRLNVLTLFLGEAIILAAMGGLAGLLIGASAAYLIHFFIPLLPVKISWFYIVLAELVAVTIGLVAGALPAARAASMVPLDALRSE
jgi:putative ABC transport system permease protein